MIYAEKKDANEENFIALLERTKGLLIPKIRLDRKIAALDFEELVSEKMCEASIGTEFEGTIERTGVHAFPDIIANGYFGVEVKTTTKDHWTSTGNSVLESLRIEDVERIYIMFGKLGGEPDVRYRLYQECLPEVSVTHSPRYKIDMSLSVGNSIFDKMGIEYNTLRRDGDSIQRIKNYYRKQLKEGEELWWIDEAKEDKLSSPVIRSLRSFDKAEKERFIVEVMVLFPEIFGSSTSKFERAAAYLITEYSAVSANLRDTFTAGGREKVIIKERVFTIPKIFHLLFSKASSIYDRVNSIDEEALLNYWRIDKIEGDRIEQWKKLLNKKSVTNLEIAASDVFEAGL